MGCSNSATINEPDQSKNISEQVVEPEVKKEKKSISFMGFSEEESEIVQSLLSKNKCEPNDVIGYKAELEFDAANSYYNEYLIVQTGKKKGQKYSGTFKFISKIVKGKYLKPYVFLNKTEVESKRVKENKYDYEQLEIEMDYELDEDESSIITIKIMTDTRTKLILTENEIYFVVIYFSSYSKSFFKINVKWSQEFYFSNTGSKPTNKFELISKQELLLSGTEYEGNSFHFRYDYGQEGYIFNKKMKYFYDCDQEELHNLELAANSVGLIYLDVNIIGIKDIFNILSTGECQAKTFIYLIHPTQRNTDTSANFFFELEQNSVQLIKSKVNNEDDDRSKVINFGSFDAINVYFRLNNEQFCVVELDYTFKLKNISDTDSKFGYNLCVNHKNLLSGGFYSCEINMEYEENLEIKSKDLFVDTADKNNNSMKLRYKGFKKGNPLVMLNLPYEK